MKRKRNQLKQQVYEYLLRTAPEARERSNRYRAIRHFLLPIYPEIEKVDKERMVALIDTAINTDRYFRLIQSEYESLRGSDYPDKVDLEKEAREEFKKTLPYTG